MSQRGLIRLLLAGILVLGSLLALSACGDDDEEEDGGTPAAETEEADGEVDISGVPELEDGILQVGSDIAYAPMEFFVEGTDTPDGFDIDLANALAEQLGVEAEFLNTGFDGIIPALQTEDFDVIMSAMTITDERSQEIDFIPYLNVGTGIVVGAGNPNSISSLEDLCGLTVAVQLGTIQEEMANAIECPGGESVEVVTFDTNPLAVEDLRTGGADANLSDLPVAALDAQESDGALELVEPQVEPEPYGIGLRKESTELNGVLEEALQAVIDDGTYDELLEEWGLELAELE